MLEHDDLTTHRKRSVLPVALQLSIVKLTENLRRGKLLPDELNITLTELFKLHPKTVARAEREIAQVGELFWRPPIKHSLFRSLFPGKFEQDVLERTPGLEYLYLFHKNGWLREAALKKIDVPLASPFLFSVIAYRLNDWAQPVRQAAHACALRVFPKTHCEIIAEAGLVLLRQKDYWRRWSNEEVILEGALMRQDVVKHLAFIFRTRTVGALGKVLRCSLRREVMDRYLLDLCENAVQPEVRAIAFRTLMEGRALWHEGFTQEWVDKSLGRSRRVAVLGSRNVCSPLPVEVLIAAGANDKAAAVRKVAADSLIQCRHSLNNVDSIIRKFANDKNQSVRERADFILRDRQRRSNTLQGNN